MHANNNDSSGATVGYMGVSSGVLGVPFMNSQLFLWLSTRNIKAIRPATIGAAVYGGLPAGLASLSAL